jgi:phage baseplate assembly protein gpV
MQDTLKFVNNVHYMSVSPEGAIISSGNLYNVTGQFMRDQIMRMLTTPASSSPGTLGQVDRAYFRVDGNTTLGSFQQYDPGGATAYSTRYSSATYVSSVMFNATYTATANVTCKAVALTLGAQGASNDVGSFSKFWSTNFNMACGSAGKLIIQWTISVP